MVHFRLKKRLKGSSSYHFGEGNGNPLQCSCLKNPREGGAWWAGVTQSWTRLKQLSSSYHLSRKSSREDHHIAMTLDKGNTIVFMTVIYGLQNDQSLNGISFIIYTHCMI